ncbi:MAG: hypothetical protein CR975_02590 [Gammaproteobacteria bacterium]|nr:MAG: hypothetical protein CR975_02590 [Gammaproteobacteria bacterium]
MIAYLSAHRRDFPGFIPDSYRSRTIIIQEQQLTQTAPASMKALLVGFTVDQILLARASAWIEDFLHSGGTLVFNGHIAHPFLSVLSRYEPLPRRGKDDLLVRPINPHPVFAGVDFMDLTERRGVRGFYGRGANPMPEDAIPINRVGESAVVDWQLNIGTGRLLVHAGINLWLYHRDKNSSARIVPQLLDWCLAEVC